MNWGRKSLGPSGFSKDLHGKAAQSLSLECRSLATTSTAIRCLPEEPVVIGLRQRF